MSVLLRIRYSIVFHFSFILDFGLTLSLCLLSSTLFALRFVSIMWMDEATVELFAIDVVPKLTEVDCVGELTISVFARPVVPEIFLENRVGGVECPAFAFFGH